jgi:hypothetical protein
MQEQTGGGTPELPKPDEIIRGIARELGLDTGKKPTLIERLPEEQLFPEEAPTTDGRYIADACLEQIYNIVLRHTPPGAPILLSKGDVRWLHGEFKQIVEGSWDLPEPCPDFTLTHLLGAAKRQIAHLSELKRFHESEVYDPALRTYSQIAFVTERAILDGDPYPQYWGDEASEGDER